jgi:hypothetical protein
MEEDQEPEADRLTGLSGVTPEATNKGNLPSRH